MRKIVDNYLNWNFKIPKQGTDKAPHMKCIPSVIYRQAIAAKMAKPWESKVLQNIMSEVSFIKTRHLKMQGTPCTPLQRVTFLDQVLWEADSEESQG